MRKMLIGVGLLGLGVIGLTGCAQSGGADADVAPAEGTYQKAEDVPERGGRQRAEGGGSTTAPGVKSDGG